MIDINLLTVIDYKNCIKMPHGQLADSGLPVFCPLITTFCRYFSSFSALLLCGSSV